MYIYKPHKYRLGLQCLGITATYIYEDGHYVGKQSFLIRM